MKIRTLESRDVEAVLSLQSECPQIAQWAVWDYKRVAGECGPRVPGEACPGEREGSRVAGEASLGDQSGWVAEENALLAGFLIARRVSQDIEILNLAVRGDARRRGVGTALLRAACRWGRQFRAEKVFLEVRESNAPAIRFYEKLGFAVAGRRHSYYAAPVEDALLLAATLSPARAIP